MSFSSTHLKQLIDEENPFSSLNHTDNNTTISTSTAKLNAQKHQIACNDDKTHSILTESSILSNEITSNEIINSILNESNLKLVNKEIANNKNTISNNADHTQFTTQQDTNLSANKTNTKNEQTLYSEIEALKKEQNDFCLSESVFGLLDEETPTYKLRADTAYSQVNIDWIKAPFKFNEQEISELSNEQIQLTLDYFILSGFRVSQMTKTYYDIDAVTRLLDEKERDLELAATIGKQLLHKDEQLEVKIEILEIELEKTSEMVNQLRYEINLKDNLIKSFIDSEIEDELSHAANEENNANSDDLKPKKIYDLNNETVNEYLKKISYLEQLNETLRCKAEYFEKETIDLETKESLLIENYHKDLEATQSTLRTAQDELETKKIESSLHQEEVQTLYTQVLDLQKKIKLLNDNNQELQSNNQASNVTLIEQITDLKEKYNECLSLLGKTQDELSVLRRKNPIKRIMSKSASACSNVTMVNSIVSSSLSMVDTEDEEELGGGSINKNRNDNGLRNNSSLFSPWMPTSNTSLASEVFSSLAKDFRTKNSTLHHQVSQSSDFIRKVKEKLTKQLPGSNNIDSCYQTSDSEIEQMWNNGFTSSSSQINSMNNFRVINQMQKSLNNSAHFQSNSKFTSCATPESMYSTGSASIYSNLIGRSSSAFMLPEKLQIVKPLEGSNTLQHWQRLGTPNLGCLFESRPGISIKGNSPDEAQKRNNIEIHEKKDKLCTNFYDEDDDGVNLDMYDEEDYDDDEREFDFNFFSKNNPNAASNLESSSGSQNLFTNEKYSMNTSFTDSDDDLSDSHLRQRSNRILSPSKFELLSRLLENDEESQNEENHQTDARENFFVGIFKNISTKFNFKSNNEQQQQQQHVRKNKRQDCDDPDTPPSSPINLHPMTTQSILYDVFESAKLKCQSAFVAPLSSYFNKSKQAPTPPGTPINSLDLANDENFDSESSDSESDHSSTQNFFDQIVKKLNLFSFKSVSDVACPIAEQQQDYLIIKPSPVYHHKGSEKAKDQFYSSATDQEDDEELIEIKKSATINRTCCTPPPSPSKFSPPLLDDDYATTTSDYNQEEEMKKSAFVKLTSLNPYINKSGVDLASLLGSLSSLKRNQRLCKYNQTIFQTK